MLRDERQGTRGEAGKRRRGEGEMEGCHNYGKPELIGFFSPCLPFTVSPFHCLSLSPCLRVVRYLSPDLIDHSLLVLLQQILIYGYLGFFPQDTAPLFKDSGPFLLLKGLVEIAPGPSQNLPSRPGEIPYKPLFHNRSPI